MLQSDEHPLMADIRALKRDAFPDAWGEDIHLTQHKINLFANATGDRQSIHVDPEKAKRTKLGGTVAHGFNVVALISGHMLEEFARLQSRYPDAVAIHTGGAYKLLSPVPQDEFVRCRGYVGSVATRSRCAEVEYVYEIALRSGRRVAAGTMQVLCMPRA
jgi:acyl dehydratase